MSSSDYLLGNTTNDYGLLFSTQELFESKPNILGSIGVMSHVVEDTSIQSLNQFFILKCYWTAC